MPTYDDSFLLDPEEDMMRMIRNASTPFVARRWSAALALIAIHSVISSSALAISLPTFSLGRNDCVTVAGLCWHTNYECARQEAESQKKMLLVK